MARRILAIANALDGMSREEAARSAGMDRQTLRDWVLRYNEHGIDGLADRWGDGRPPTFDEQEQAELMHIVLDGPDPEASGLSAYTLEDLANICEQRFGKRMHPWSLGRLLKRLGFSRQKTRPSHPQKDPAAQAAFRRAPALLRKIQRTHKNKRIRLFFQDEARIGQKGRTCHIWCRRGERPPGLCDKRFTFAYIFAAVEPGTDNAFALVMPYVNTEAMQVFLDRFAATVGDDEHVAMVLDQAGWHGSGALRIPDNITLVPLPPYAPELNPVERVWLHLKERFLSHRLLADYDAIVDAACNAWNRLCVEVGRLTSLCSVPRISQVRR